MMQNLREKLLKAGVVDRKAKKKADHQIRQDRAQRRKMNKKKTHQAGQESIQKDSQTEENQEEKKVPISK